MCDYYSVNITALTNSCWYFDILHCESSIMEMKVVNLMLGSVYRVVVLWLCVGVCVCVCWGGLRSCPQE